MSPEGLADLLLADHRLILKSGHELLRLSQNCGGADEEKCFELFRHFKALVNSRLKAEEYVLYVLYEDPKQPSGRLRDFVFEAYEEHDLIDLLLKEMGQAEELSPQWLAKLKVVCGLLERHLEGEDREFLPLVKEVLKDGESAELAARYGQERDQIYKKKSGSKPAPLSRLI